MHLVQGATLHRIEQVMGTIVIDQGDGKDFMGWEATTQVQVVSSHPHQIQLRSA